MIQYNPKTRVIVEGKMSKEDAGFVGRRLSTAALVFSWMSGMAAVLYAVAQLLAVLLK